jgi:hypothetical protein
MGSGREEGPQWAVVERRGWQGAVIDRRALQGAIVKRENCNKECLDGDGGSVYQHTRNGRVGRL